MADNMVMAALLTIALEVAVAVLLGFKSKKTILAVIFLNLLSGPLLNFLFALSDLAAFIAENPVLKIALLLIIVAEWLLLVFILRDSRKKLLRLSVLMNLCSFAAVMPVF